MNSCCSSSCCCKHSIKLLADDRLLHTYTYGCVRTRVCMPGVLWMQLSFFIARGFIKTGLGSRLAYGLLALNASSALRLGYALVLTDLILSPAVPSVTARCGGIVFPIVRGLASSLGSDASSPASAAIIGSYLITVSFQTTVITSAMFMTAMVCTSGPPLAS